MSELLGTPLLARCVTCNESEVLMGIRYESRDGKSEELLGKALTEGFEGGSNMGTRCKASGVPEAVH